MLSLEQAEKLNNEILAVTSEILRLRKENSVMREALEKLASPRHAPIEMFVKDVQFYVLTARQALEKHPRTKKEK